MKWGVRKVRASRAKTPTNPSGDAKKVAEIRKKRPHEMTNKQLETVNKRLGLEQNYNKMTPSAIKRGTVAAAAILATAQLGITAYNMLQSPAAKAASKNARRAIKVQKRRGQQQLFF
jgi:hypothetical protein